MPIVTGTDLDFTNITVPGSGPYAFVNGAPTRNSSILPPKLGTASLQIDGTESVLYAIGGSSPKLPWHGFYFRIDTEPAADVDVARFEFVAGADGRLAYSPSSHKLYHFIAGSGSDASAVLTLTNWYWVEQIADVTTSTVTIYTQVNGVDFIPQSAASSASSGLYSDHGQFGATVGFTYYQSVIKWGYATSVTNWLGQPTGTAVPDTSRLPKKLMLARP